MNARTQGRCGSLTVHAQTHHAYPTHVMHWNYVRDRDAKLVTIIKSSLYTSNVALDLCCTVALECNTFGKLDSQV